MVEGLVIVPVTVFAGAVVVMVVVCTWNYVTVLAGHVVAGVV